MRSYRSSALILAFLGSLVLGLGVMAQDRPKPSPRGPRALKVGVVDIGLLFKEYERKDELEKNINDQRERIKKDLDEEHEKVRQMKVALDESGLRESSPPYLAEVERIRIATYKLELKSKRLQADLKNAVEQNTLQILTELEGTIARYGKKYAYDLILKIDRAERDATEKGSELVEHFQERIFRAQISDVLYFNGDQLDITGSVLKILNTPANKRRIEREAEERKRQRARAQRPPAKSGDEGGDDAGEGDGKPK